MFTRWYCCTPVVLAALLLSASPSRAVTLSLDFSGGSIADPITDSIGTALGVGEQIFLYASPTVLDSSDLFSSIFQLLPGGGLSFITPAAVLVSTSIGSGIAPPTFLEGRVRGQLDLGNLQSPTVATGTLLFLLAIDAIDLAQATEAGIAIDSFTVPLLPDINADPPLAVDYTTGGFATVVVPETTAALLVVFGFLGVTLARSRLLSG